MKKILTIIIGLAASGLALPATAQASGLRQAQVKGNHSGHHTSGYTIQTKRVLAGYDKYRRPIYRYVKIPVVQPYRANVRSPRVNYRNQSNYRSNDRRTTYRTPRGR